MQNYECICISSEINLANIRWKINIFPQGGTKFDSEKISFKWKGDKDRVK